MKVFITGGSGFLGRGLLMRAKELDWEVTVYSRDEYKQDLCKRRFSSGVNYVLGDVTNYDRLLCAMKGHDVVIHTAAIKYIPEAEVNVSECIHVNIEGSRNVLRAAEALGVSQCVCISTDKATIPVNVYGMTKAIVERLVGEFSHHVGTDTKFTACRYGNVVGSTGSVIPLFQRQMQENKRVTITDPDMTRYWIGINEAVDLVLACMDWANNGSVVIPQPASMRLLDLAVLIAGSESNIDVIGVRPGEKRHEQLLHQQESVRAKLVGTYYELLRSGEKAVSEPFMLSSSAPKVWLSQSRMRELIQESALV